MYDISVARIAVGEPRNLAGLIHMYESNYLRLMRLTPELQLMRGTTVSRVAGALDLYLTVIARSRYTTTISLTYRFTDADEYVAEPAARIRVYHDAKMVEVTSHARRKRVQPNFRWRAGYRPELDRKWELNRFLQKWLGFCRRQGHLFLNCTTTRVD